MKNNLPLIIGIALPLIFIAIISVFLFIPKTLINPEHNFVYINFDIYNYKYSYENTYKLVNGRIEKVPSNIPEEYYNDRYGVIEEAPKLYLYNVADDTSREITFEEAQEITLVAGPSSPDGYTVSYKYSHDGIFEIFGGSSNNRGYYISKGNSNKKLVGLVNDEYYSPNGFQLIGWEK